MDTCIKEKRITEGTIDEKLNRFMVTVDERFRSFVTENYRERKDCWRMIERHVKKQKATRLQKWGKIWIEF